MASRGKNSGGTETKNCEFLFSFSTVNVTLPKNVMAVVYGPMAMWLTVLPQTSSLSLSLSLIDSSKSSGHLVDGSGLGPREYNSPVQNS